MTLTTIAPTGTISMVAECSSGIEPVFALSYVKNVVDDLGLTYINPYFEQAMDKVVEDDSQKQQIIEEVVKTGSCQNIKELPDSIKQIFVTAHDITWQDHVRMQAALVKKDALLHVYPRSKAAQAYKKIAAKIIGKSDFKEDTSFWDSLMGY